jgi:ribosomal protein S18 acetylase RimI-like enzyme
MGPNGKGRRTPENGSSPAEAAIDHLAPPAPATGSADRITVRGGVAADADAAASLHAGQIADGFLAVLGPRFLALLYRRISLSAHSFLLIADRGGTSAGFLAGSTDVGGLYKNFVWHDGPKALVAAAGPLLTGWRRVLETLRHGSSGGAGVGRGAELLAVAVDPAQQGRGAGRSLVAAFLDEVSARGGDAAHVVVGADNAGAIALYERAGFVIADRFELHPGTQSLLMQWDRPTSGQSAGAGRN